MLDFQCSTRYTFLSKFLISTQRRNKVFWYHVMTSQQRRNGIITLLCVLVCTVIHHKWKHRYNTSELFWSDCACAVQIFCGIALGKLYATDGNGILSDCPIWVYAVPYIISILHLFVCQGLFYCLVYILLPIRTVLTFTTLWANSADNKCMIFFLLFPQNRLWHFMQIVSNGDNFHEMSKPVFWGKNRQMLSICRLLK